MTRTIARRIATAALVLTVASAGAASANHETGAWPPAGGIGVKLYATGGPVAVEVMDATAAYTSELYLASPGPRQLLATNRDVGDIVNIGTFTEGTELVFEIDVLDTGYTYSTGPGDRNPDGEPHAAAEEHPGGEIIVGFEDIHADDDSDMDYDDNVFEFTGSLTAGEPAATTLVANPAIIDLVPSVDLYFPQLSATLSVTDGGAGIAGKTIVFRQSTTLVGTGIEICTAVTDATGLAACGDIPEEIEAVLGVGYEASFAGDVDYAPASDHAPIVRVAGVDVL